MSRITMSIALSFLFLQIATASGAEGTAGRSIAVTGQADVKVAPDKVEITLGVATTSAKLEDAKREHDEKMKGLLALATTFKLEPADVRTEYVRIRPFERRDNSGKIDETGYEMRQAVTFVLHDLTKYQSLLSAAIAAGANFVEGIDFQTSELRKHRDRARGLAISAAREKAVGMSAELKQSIGRPLSITEMGYNEEMWQSGLGGGGFAGGAKEERQGPAGGDVAEEKTIAPGMITVSAIVSVKFELLDGGK